VEGTDNTLARVREAFGLTGDMATLPGGTRPTYRVGETVLKYIHDTSLENNGSRDLVQWLAALFDRLTENGFRIPRPRRTRSGTWMTDDGWTAWSLLAGRHAETADIPACIGAILALHRALDAAPKHALLDSSTTPWAVAHRACLGERPAFVHPTVAPLVDRLYALRQPVPGVRDQLLHGDLNPENILIAPAVPPAFIDMSPFWGPVELAVAIFANWIGPRHGDASALRWFEGVGHFEQMLVRAAIRMLLVMSELGEGAFEDWDTSPEREAAQIILRYIEER
jgi:Ser/Thr protein kinase RdoA (MazF antagonist)